MRMLGAPSQAASVAIDNFSHRFEQDAIQVRDWQEHALPPYCDMLQP
jgi:hypothetical protein